DDVRRAGSDVVIGPQVEREAHRLPVTVAEQRLDVLRKSDELAWCCQRQVLGAALVASAGRVAPVYPSHRTSQRSIPATRRSCCSRSCTPPAILTVRGIAHQMIILSLEVR